MALRRTPPVARFVHPLRLAILGIVTAGLWPCRMLAQRVYRVTAMQAYQLELAGQMLEPHVPAEDAALLRESFAKGRPTPLWSALVQSFWWASLAFAVLFLLNYHGSGFAIGRLLFHPLRYANPYAQVYLACLAASYLLLIVQMNRQIVAMQQLALAINGVFDDQPHLPSPPLVYAGHSPLTLTLGVVLAWFGMLWALPMAIAWSAFRAFVRSNAYGFRVALAERLVGLTGAAPVVATRDLCPNPQCRHLIPETAAFCPRCGTPVQRGTA